MNQNKIYFIGGASCSGKSIVAREISTSFAMTIVELDKFYNAFPNDIKETIGKKAIRPIAFELVIQLLEQNQFCIIEGGWISIAKAAELRDRSDGRFTPVFCGYPDADVEERFDKVKGDAQHWMARPGNEVRARAFMLQQKEVSKQMRDTAPNYGVSFFDFSRFEEGNKALKADFDGWIKES